jgi:Tol biopolymer transport system component/predicted Ser/Thr protein kinase
MLMQLSPGTRLGPYEILAPLGAGGMGEVYRARDTKLKRDVALKVLPEPFALDPDRMARFQREAEVLASLNHPNIAAIYGVEESALVMELVEGENLKGPLPIDTALNYARQIAEALEAAHEKGIIHRDLKPANVMITPAGVVKVLDFGLAKIAEPVAGNPASSPTLTMGASEPGMIMGTAAYMAPEQARGQTVDKRADIWAFGVVLWEMLTGTRMFPGKTVSDVLAGVLKNEPDLQAVPQQVRRLLARCLEKDPRKRLRDIGDWRDVVEDSTAGRATRRRTWVVITGLLAAALAISLWAPWRAPRSVADRPLVQLDLDVGDEVSQPAISPDGMRIVFVSKDHLAIRRLDQSKITTIAGTEGASFPFFSPDGQWVGFFAAGKLQKIAVEGGAPVTLCDAPNGRGGSWGDDGNIIAALQASGGLSRVPAAGGTPQPLTDLKADTAGILSHRWPQALPGGKGVLFTATNLGSQGSLRIVTPNTGKLKTVVENSTHGRYLVSGYLVYNRRGTLFAAPMDPGRLELTGPAVPLLDGVSYSSSGQADFDLSGSGTLVYRRGMAETNRIPSWLYSSGKIERVGPKPGNYRTPGLSPDGTRLALALDQEGPRNLWIYNLSRETMTRLTFDPDPESFPTWTPDGEFLAFRSGNMLAWTRSDGSGKVERLATASRNATPGSFSADGKWLALSQIDPQTALDLWTVPVEQTAGGLRFGQPQPLLQQAGFQGSPAISPDGRWVAYMSDESGRFEIYVMPFSPQGSARGGKWQVSNGGGSNPIWSHSGRELFYENLDRRVQVAAYTVKGGSFLAEESRLWSGKQLADVSLSRSFDVAPDGKRVVALLDAEDAKPETSLHVLLNVGDELRRRTGVK